MAMIWPYSNLAIARTTVHDRRERYLLATAGGRLLVSSLDAPRSVSEWNAHEEPDESSQPRKKQKVEHDKPRVSNIILLATNQLVDDFVVVTEDKALHVLSLSESGVVTESSRRPMPKRPCAIHILDKERTILCADKFGDVYSLPLLPDPQEPGDPEKAEAEAEQPTFTTSATELTVHTQRNRRALETQRKQQNFTKRKEGLDFKHDILLGHISMLTDLAYVDAGFIITSDRDEHIRVSRAAPQAHIIGGYCLGHTEFISKLCPLPTTPYIASGGGDDWLGIWDWTTFELRSEIELKQALVNSGVKLHDEKGSITVSKMISLPITDFSTSRNVLFVLCEHVKAIVAVTLRGPSLVGLHVTKTEETPITLTGLSENILVSFDVRKADETRLREYTLVDRDNVITLEESARVQNAVKRLEDEKTRLHVEKGLDELLYYIGNFRKRRDFAGQAAEDLDDIEDREMGLGVQ